MIEALRMTLWQWLAGLARCPLANSDSWISLARRQQSKTYRNPVIYARELHDEMVTDHLARRQLASLHGVSADRVTQWLCLLKLPEEQRREIEALGDHWSRQVITERQLRKTTRPEPE